MVKKVVEQTQIVCDICGEYSTTSTKNIYRCSKCNKDLCSLCMKRCKKCLTYLCPEHIYSLNNDGYCINCYEKIKIKKQIRESNFKIELDPPKSQVFKNIIEFLEGCMDEVECEIKDNKFIINAIDFSRISLITLYIPLSEFNQFDHKTNHLLFNLELKDFKSALINLESDESIQIIREKGQIICSISNHLDLTREISFIDTKNEIEVLPLENLEKIAYPVKIPLDSKKLRNILLESHRWAEVLSIESTPGNILTLKTETHLGPQYKASYKVNPSFYKNNVKANYSSSFLTHFTTLNPDYIEFVELAFNEENPLRIKLGFLNKFAVLTMYLAPRVDEESELNKEEN